ncbi:General substrate transporter [Penicillium vulpinum]|uniref:Major facilitator superfamily (MFS) profile domain-containing protein n=1 Tax=Penicillium vulpinum TaxID=29845 RepID=A0A1V6RHB0_9EURO|nr:General substrate transporter [Penicillium vulpinum]KAJ5972600.1 General substrate transporter [Penicillium vulpinum]OQE01201.1 hypothetical protein PENVUL_c044G06484 [Penicillium vulpinum]
MADIPATKELSHDPVVEGFSHHADDIASDREPYGPPGLRGLAANPFVVLCAACSTLGGLLFGYDQGVVSVILIMEQFLVEFPRIEESNPGSGFAKGLLTAMIELGALIGALNQGWIADKISRRYSILVAVAIFTVGSVMQTAAYGYPMLTVARLIGGIGIGMLSMVAPLYISEISPPECRGTLLVMEEWCIVLGIVIAFWITYGTQFMAGEWAWRLPFLLQLIPGFVLAAGVYALPFSPRWLASKGRDEEALASLCRLRSLPASDRRVRQELMDIQAEVRFHQEMNRENHPDLQGGGRKNSILLELSSWADCFKKGCWRRTHIGIGLGFFQQFIGINALIYYSPTLFATMGLDRSMQLIMSGVLNVVQLVGVTTSIWTMDVIGRRKLLMAGAALMALSHIIIAALVGIFSVDWPSHKAEGWTSVAFLLFYMLAFGASWGPIPWAMPSEIFPSSLRAKGVALSTCSNWLNNFIIGLITPPLVQNTGYGAYVFFAVFCVLAGVWTFLFVPETKGRTLEQMDHVFKDNSSEEEKVKRRAIENELIRAQYENVHQEFA